MHIAGVCRKVGRQINVLNRLKNILPLKTKEALYHLFILPYFNYYSQVWHHCGTRNARKLEKVNERALRYAYKDKHKSYNELLERAGQVTLENRRIQDILITVNNCLMNRAPESIKNLIFFLEISFLHTSTSQWVLEDIYGLSMLLAEVSN